MWNICGIILYSEKQKYLEKNLSYYYFVHLKSHTEWPGLEVVVPL
jgi:hypothetical protein